MTGREVTVAGTLIGHQVKREKSKRKEYIVSYRVLSLRRYRVVSMLTPLESYTLLPDFHELDNPSE